MNKYRNTHSRPITIFLNGDFVTIGPNEILDTPLSLFVNHLVLLVEPKKTMKKVKTDGNRKT